MDKYLEKLRYYSKRRSIRYAVPFLLCIVGGSFALKEFTSLRYQFTRTKTVSREEAEKFGFKMKKRGEVTLETEYEKLKEIDIDNWTQKRGPRPWEEN